MKKLLKLTVVFAAFIVLGACSSNSSTPKDVAEKFLNHLNNKEYDKAKEYGTENTVQMIEMIKSFSKLDEKSEAAPIKIDNLKCDIDGEKAKCSYSESGEEKTIDLVKKDSKWLVDMKKEAQNPNSAEEMENMGEEIENAIGDALDSTMDAVKEAAEEIEEAVN